MKKNIHFIEPNWFFIGRNNYNCFLARIYLLNRGKRIMFTRTISNRLQGDMISLNMFLRFVNAN